MCAWSPEFDFRTYTAERKQKGPRFAEAFGKGGIYRGLALICRKTGGTVNTLGFIGVAGKELADKLPNTGHVR